MCSPVFCKAEKHNTVVEWERGEISCIKLFSSKAVGRDCYELPKSKFMNSQLLSIISLLGYPHL